MVVMRSTLLGPSSRCRLRMLRTHREVSVSGARLAVAYVLAMTSRMHRLVLALCMAGCTGPTIERPPGEDGAIAIDAGTMPPMDGASACSAAVEPCTQTSECCGDLECGTTTAGQVCCGNEGASCATAGGEDCCGSLLCVSGRCGTSSGDCHSPCFPAPALAMERTRLAAIGGSFLGICGDASHTYGYHVPAARLPSTDYSMRGAANVPVCEWHGCAIDIGMNWPASRSWLRWLIQAIREDRIMGIAEVIGSYDGVNVRYWSDSSGWSTDGMAYTGSGHDSWTHVSIYRSTALTDHGILAGWTATAGPP